MAVVGVGAVAPVVTNIQLYTLPRKSDVVGVPRDVTTRFPVPVIGVAIKVRRLAVRVVVEYVLSEFRIIRL